MNKATEIVSDMVEQLDLTNIFRTLYQKKKKIPRRYILFKCTLNIL